MATAGNIKVVKLGTDEYELLAKYIQGNSGEAKTWADIEALVNVGLKIVIDDPNTAGTAPKTAASAATMGKLYMVQLAGTASGTYTEFVTVENPTGTYNWEKIGTTDVDLSTYAKKGDYDSDSQGAHTHDVTGTVTVPTVAKTSKKLAATASGTDLNTTTENVVTGISTTDDKVLGVGTTFAVSGGAASKTNVKATASGTAVGSTGTADAITGLGTPTTADAITALGEASTAKAITGFAAHPNDKVLGVGTTFAVNGGAATKTNIKATASGTELETSSDNTFLKSYSGATKKLQMGSVTGINGSANVPSSVSATAGSPASWSASVDAAGALTFSWTANTPTAVTVGDNVTVAKPASGATTIVSGIGDAGTGADVMVGLGTATTGSALTAASVKTQPTIALSTGATAGAGVIEVATDVSAVTVSANADDQVDALTGLGTPTTADAITGFGTHTTAKAITGFGTHTTAACLTGVEVTAQPTIALSTGATAGAGVVEVATGVSAVTVTANADDQVDALITATASGNADVIKTVSVKTQPTITLDGNAATGVDYVDSVTIGTDTASLTNGAAAEAGAHIHTTTL